VYRLVTIGEVYDSATMGPAPTVNQSTIDANLSAAFKQLHAINVSMTTERARGNGAGVAALLPLYRKWLDEYKRWSRIAGQYEFTEFDQFLLDMQNWAEHAVGLAVKGLIPLVVGAISIYTFMTRRHGR
jgi:hypothetical protein